MNKSFWEYTSDEKRLMALDYLANLSYEEKNDFDIDLRNIESAKSIRKYKSGKKYYQKQKKKQEETGEKFKGLIEVGDHIKVRGTRDGRGIREVLSFNDYELTCQKIIKNWNMNGGGYVFKKDKYITTHMWNKVIKILSKVKLTT